MSAATDLLQLAREHTPREIAGIIGVSASTVRKRLNSLGLKQNLRVTVSRPCMCCGREFAPEHRFNRLCAGCIEETPDYEVKA